MKSKLKLLIVSTVIMSISIYSYAFADTVPNTDSNNAPAIINLSLDDALNLVEKGNTDIILMTKKIELYDRQYQTALAQQKTQEGNGNDIDEDDMKIKKLNAPVALANLNNEKNDKDDKLKSVKVEISREYESILAAQMNVDNINEQISNLKINMDQVNQSIELGLTKASDIDEYKAKMAALESNFSSQQRDIDTAMLTLKQDLGMDLNAKINLTSKPISYEKFDDSNIEGRIQKSISNNYEFVRLKQDIENAKIEDDIYIHFTDIEQDAAEINIEDKQTTLDKLPNDLYIQFKGAYNKLKSLENDVEAEKLNVETYEINYDIAQANFDSDQIQNIELLNAKQQFSEEKNVLQQKIIAYMVAVDNFKNSLKEQ